MLRPLSFCKEEGTHFFSINKGKRASHLSWQHLQVFAVNVVDKMVMDGFSVRQPQTMSAPLSRVLDSLLSYILQIQRVTLLRRQYSMNQRSFTLLLRNSDTFGGR